MSIFLCYHCPCLDGAYSLLCSFLFFREMQREGISAKDFICYVSQFDDYQSISRTLRDYKKDPDRPLELHKEQKINRAKNNLDDYSPSIIKHAVYIPVKMDTNGAFHFLYSNYKENLLKDSALIFMDYSGGSVDNLVELSKRFRKIIIIDHHLSFEHLITKLKALQEPPTNIIYLYDKKKCGASLILEFFEKIKGDQLLANQDKYTQLLTILKYVEDHDTKAGKVEDSESFVAGILRRNLFELDIPKTIEEGSKEQKDRDKWVQVIIQDKRVIYLGGRTKEGKGKYGLCYGVLTDELQLRNEIGTELAKESIKDGMENMGLFYSYISSVGKYRISLRSLKDFSGGDCEVIAREYSGGGHYNAAGFFLTKKQMKKWL